MFIINVKNVNDTISWQGHHDRVTQLNWLYFCGICQLISLKLWPNIVQGCNHQSTCMPQLQPLCSAALVPYIQPRRMKAQVSPVQWSKPHSILAPSQDSNPGSRIQNHKWWPLHCHCNLFITRSNHVTIHGNLIITWSLLVNLTHTHII